MLTVFVCAVDGACGAEAQRAASASSSRAEGTAFTLRHGSARFPGSLCLRTTRRRRTDRDGVPGPGGPGRGSRSPGPRPGVSRATTAAKARRHAARQRCSWLDGEAELLGGVIAGAVGHFHGEREGPRGGGGAGELVVVISRRIGRYQRQPGRQRAGSYRPGVGRHPTGQEEVLRVGHPDSPG